MEGRPVSTPRQTSLAARAASIAGKPPTPTVSKPVGAEPVGTESTKGGVPAVASAPSTAAPRVKPVRVVVEMQPVEHRNLRRLADRYAEELGVPQVAMSEVLRVLHELAQKDERIAAQVSAELARTGGSRRR